MKILIVMQVYDEFSLLDNIKKYNSILNFSFMENVKTECAVFSEYNFSTNILEKYIQNKVSHCHRQIPPGSVPGSSTPMKSGWRAFPIPASANKLPMPPAAGPANSPHSP